MRLKNRKLVLILCTFFIVLIPMGFVFAASNSASLAKDEIFPKDWFTFSQNTRNEGVVKGDVIFLAQYLTSEGKVEGDVLGAASEINISGDVSGDARVAASSITLSGDIGKNINLFANSASLTDTFKMGGNLIAFANRIEINGSIKGYTRLNCENVILGGEFFGDVDVNLDNLYGDNKATLYVLPDTKIHGKLTYKGINEAIIEKDTEIASFQWIQTVTPPLEENTSKNGGYYVWKYTKVLVGTLLYFFIPMLLYKLFPKTFLYQGEVINQKPLSVAGIGLISVALIPVSLLTFIFLLVVTALIASPSIAFIFAAIMMLIYILLFYFAAVPVSLWIGNLLFKERYRLQWRFGAGLLLITLLSNGLHEMGNISMGGIVFSTLRFVLLTVVVIIGMGAIVYSLARTLKIIQNSERI